MRNLNTKISLAAFSALLLPAISLADGCSSKGNGVKLCVGDGDFKVLDVILKVKDWILLITGAVAVLFIIWGGFVYITSAGNEKRVENAKQTLTYAIIGLIVVLLAQVITTLVGNTLNAVT